MEGSGKKFQACGTRDAALDGHLPSIHNALGPHHCEKKSCHFELGMAAHSYNPSPLETEAGGSGVSFRCAVVSKSAWTV